MQYTKAVKLLTRPYDNKLTKEQAEAVQSLTDRVEFLESKIARQQKINADVLDASRIISRN